MNQRQAGLDPFRTHYIAHRGLFDNARDYPENTLAAFRRAVDAGFGIELDVYLTSDEQVVVVHDGELQRLCGENVNVTEMMLKELQRRRILGSSQTIPLLSDVLDVIGGRVPLIVEYKTVPHPSRVCELTNQLLSDYDGQYCIESFDPRVLLWYRLHRPDVIRGQLSGTFAGDDTTGNPLADWALRNMVFNALTWPDFIAFEVQGAALFPLHFWHRVLRNTLVAWTIKTPEQLELSKHLFDVAIFDSFTPDGTGPQ